MTKTIVRDTQIHADKKYLRKSAFDLRESAFKIVFETFTLSPQRPHLYNHCPLIKHRLLIVRKV